ncbi:Cmx/CmrA family chloramphenicol efflux MFS transporter [Amycolatopsis albispora]|uniref:Chemotaxis protein n=1 Tax=Amycolatopsis albispora TaxID=1804986 RepID=A0A344L003_9PSEU|nr:Cmx/CmrA family chloramphenicol efflux MFS transporter [Amycolatopsis albispora]AXB41377.1 chemotaxis protein [Amycolatopsis albispora]
MSARAGQAERARKKPDLPIVVYVLGLSLFAMGSSEFLISGVLPKVADDLRVSLPSAGVLISAFAVGVLVGAPPLAVLTLRWPRRATLLASQALFVASIALGMLARDYWLVLVSRVISGLAYAGFWAVAMTTAVSLVPPDRTARALSVVVSGLSLAMVVGGPAGTVISDLGGWRAGFWAVAVATAATAVAVRLTLRQSGPLDGPPPELRAELRVMKQPRLWVAYTTTIATTAAYMVSFGYLGALLSETSGLPVAWIPAALSLFGIGAFVGLTIGGRLADRSPFRVLTAGILGMISVSVALALLADHLVAAIVLTFLLGVTGFLVNPAVIGRVYTIAASAPTLAGATNVSAFQLGIFLAPLLGGLAIGANFGLASVGWVGAALAVVSLAAALTDARLHRTPAQTDEPQAVEAKEQPIET